MLWQFLLMLLGGVAGYHFWQYVVKEKGYSKIARIGGGGLIGIFGFFVMAAIVVPKEAENIKAVIQTTESVPPKELEAEVAAPVIDHNYSMKDGYEYGYEQAVSADAENAGQVATELLMFKYAGKKDGMHQVYVKNNAYMTSIIECAEPCEFMKIIQHIKGSSTANTQRLRAVPGSVGYGVIEDAINGKLEQFIGEKDGKKYTIWFTEKKPIKTYL